MPTQQEQIDYLLRQVALLQDAGCGCEDCSDSHDDLNKVINFGSASSPFDGPVNVADFINNLPNNATDYKTVENNQMPIFVGYVSRGRQRATFNKYRVTTYGKGIYGVDGDITLTEDDLELIEESLVGGPIFPDINNDPNADVKDLGEIPGGDFLAVINSGAQFVIQPGTNCYFEFTVAGQRQLWSFDGANGTYGSGATVMLPTDVFLLYDETNSPDPVSYSLDLSVNQLSLLVDGVVQDTFDLSLYLDDTNLARLVSGVVVGTDLIVTRDDATQFTIDVSNLVPSGFRANGGGYSLIGRVEANYGTPGLYAVDASYNNSPSTLHGALGQYAFAAGAFNQIDGQGAAGFGLLNKTANVQAPFTCGQGNESNGTSSFSGGNDNKANGPQSFAIGNQTEANGNQSFSQGFNTRANGTNSAAFNSSTQATGSHSFAAGQSTIAPSFGEFAVGTFPTVYIPNSAVAFDAGDRAFVVGNGTAAGLSTSDAFAVWKDGRVLAPDLSNAKIDAATGDVLITKDWFNANVGGGGGITTPWTNLPASGPSGSTWAVKYRIINDVLFVKGTMSVSSGGGTNTYTQTMTGVLLSEQRRIPVVRLSASLANMKDINVFVTNTGNLSFQTSAASFQTIEIDAEITLNI